MLILFDVDGTLTRTSELDSEVYARAFQATFGAALPTRDWSAYAHATDSGIVEEAVARLGLDPARVPEFRRCFVAELERELSRIGCRPVSGADSVLERAAAAGHVVALATGGYEASVRLKLAAAGIRVRDVVVAASDAQPSRVEILRRARRLAGHPELRAVYVGDGPWDVEAARALRLPFVGVDPDRDGRLRALGVERVVQDFQDIAAFLAEIEVAEVP